MTLNGGAGTDTFQVGSGLVATTTAAVTYTSLSAVQMVVAYGAGDIINLGTSLATTQSNWAGGGVFNISAAAGFSAAVTTAGNLDAQGDIGVFSDNTDSFIAIQTNATNTSSTLFVIKIVGKDLTNTTLFGNQATTKFGFSVDYGASAAGLKITLT